MKGPLIILSGPSGVGKSTVIRRMLATTDLPLHLSVSATTRDPRPGDPARNRPPEQDGVDYYFWDRKRFEEAIAAGAFLEWAKVYGNNYYGTLISEVEPYREQDTGVILDIDTQGAAQVKQKCPDVIRVLLRASSPAAYEQRLRERHTEDEPTIQRRLAGAQRELAAAQAAGYEFEVINDELEAAVASFQQIVRRLFERSKTHAG
jgi:guanylate kinase